MFDKNGNLWVAFDVSGNQSTSGIEMFPASALPGEGTSTPVPAITINDVLTEGTYDFDLPSGLAFDAAGDLWVGNSGQLSWERDYSMGGLAEFTPTQVTASGNPVPIRIIIPDVNQQNLAAARFITFGPPFAAIEKLRNGEPRGTCYLVSNHDLSRSDIYRTSLSAGICAISRNSDA